MNPAIIDLPDIYRGCLYPAISFNWKNPAGGIANLNGWIPLCFAKEFQFTLLTDTNLGQTRMVLNQGLTSGLRLGKQKWDFIWLTGGIVFPPVLSGIVTIRETLTPAQLNTEQEEMAIEVPPLIGS